MGDARPPDDPAAEYPLTQAAGPSQPLETAMTDRARGCLVGSAIGDALGMPVEFAKHRLPISGMEAGRLPAGSFTDDTEQAIILAEALIEGGRIGWADLFARGLLRWYDTGPSDVGSHTSAVLAQMRNGVTWQRAARVIQEGAPDSAGNGSLMRVHPVALAYASSLDDCLRVAGDQGRVTHAHDDCVAACQAAAAIIWHELQGDDAASAMKKTLELIQWPANVRKVLDEAARGRFPGQMPSSGWVVATLRRALYAVVTTSDFSECILKVVNLGGDTDTDAAIAGAIAGAQYGMAGIPGSWRAALKGTWPIGSPTSWTQAQFMLLADRLAARSPS